MACPAQAGFVLNYNTSGGDWGAGSFREGATHHHQECRTGLLGGSLRGQGLERENRGQDRDSSRTVTSIES